MLTNEDTCNSLAGIAFAPYKSCVVWPSEDLYAGALHAAENGSLGRRPGRGDAVHDKVRALLCPRGCSISSPFRCTTRSMGMFMCLTACDVVLVRSVLNDAQQGQPVDYPESHVLNLRLSATTTTAGLVPPECLTYISLHICPEIPFPISKKQLVQL
jgi:hypothetical protein